MGRGMTKRRLRHAGRADGSGAVASRRRSLPMPKRSSSSPTADVAETVLRLAVLLQAGVSPARAWEHLAHSGDPAAVHVASSIGEGMPLPQAIATAGPGAWREVGIACQVALVVGAPLADCLRGLAVALRDAHEAADDVRVALAEPAGTARLMSWLPLVAVGLGAALGFDTFGTLFTNPLGLACLAGGAVLIVVAQRWTARLVRSAQTAGDVPGLDAELIAIALTGGVSIDRARTVVRDARALRGAEQRTDGPAGCAGPGRRCRSGRRERRGGCRAGAFAERRCAGGRTAARLGSSRAPPRPHRRTTAGRPALLAAAPPARRLHAARVPPPRSGPDDAERHVDDVGLAVTAAALYAAYRLPARSPSRGSRPRRRDRTPDRARTPLPSNGEPHVLPLVHHVRAAPHPSSRRASLPPPGADRELADDAGAATAEYAIATMAAVAFAGLLVVIMRSDEVRGILTELVRRALTVA